MDELVSHANTCDLSEFAALTPLVTACAEAGDQVAFDLLVREGQELGGMAVLTHRKLERIEGAAVAARFAFAGSVLAHVSPLREAVIARLRAEFAEAEIQTDPAAPVEGALFRARQVTA